MNDIQIANKKIGKDHKCLIIAEAGVNHNGDLDKAKLLIDIACKAEVDIVKFQTWKTEELLTEASLQADYQKENTGIDESQFLMLKKLELGYDDFRELSQYCTQKGIIFMSTPDEEKSVDFLDELDVPAFKIGSGEVTNLGFIEYVAKKGKPIIMSTGMATLEEIREALSIIHDTGNEELVLLHCTTQYPTKYQDVNMRAMLTLQKEFKTNVGYSDHTENDLASITAVALGAVVLEKHFTYDKRAQGPDHICSLEPEELRNYVISIRNTEKLLGSYNKSPTSEEIKIRKIVRKTLVASCSIPKGTIIERKHLIAKRSNGNLLPNELHKIVGKTTQKKYQKDESFMMEDFS